MKIRSVLALVGVSLGLMACSDSDDPAAPALTSVRVIHAVPDAPAVNIDLNAARTIEGLDYAANSGTLAPVAASYDIDVNAMLPGGAEAAVIQADGVALAAGTRYTIIALGTVDETDGFPLEPLVIGDTGSLQSSANVRVKVAHLASNAPAVDVYITAPAADLNSATPTLAGVAFKDVSDALEVPGGAYQIRITLEGTQTVAYDSGAVGLAAGRDLLVGAISNDGAGTSPVKLVVFDASSATAIPDVAAGADLRVVHASPDVGAVDVLLDNIPTGITNFTFGSVAPSATGYVTNLPAAVYNVKVNVAGTDTSGINEALTLVNGNSYTALAVGKLSDGSLDLLALEDQRRSIATQATVRLVHAATLAGEVNIFLTGVGEQPGSKPAFSAVPFKAETGFFGVAEGSWDVVVVPVDSTAEALRTTVSVEKGGLYTAIVRDNDAADGVSVIVTDDFIQ
jgi:hypothetical protein